MKRGDVFIAAFPHADGSPTKDRPVLVVQSDFYNTRIQNVLIATITSNLSRQNDPAHVLIDVSTANGRKSGLKVDSLVSCINVAVVRKAKLKRRIGELSDDIMQQVNDCLRAAFAL